MKKMSLARLYFLSSLKSSFINVTIMTIVLSIGVYLFNQNEIKNTVQKKKLDLHIIEQIDQFQLVNNKDALDLLFIDLKLNQSFETLEIVSSPKIANCSEFDSVLVCQKSKFYSYQKLPISENKFIKYSYSAPKGIHTSYLYGICLLVFILNLLSSYLSSVFARKEIKRQIRDIESNSLHGPKINEFEKISSIAMKGMQSKIDESIARSNIQIIRKLQHDAQSPLTTLEYFFSEIKFSLSEELRLMGKQSIERVQDIINTLKINEDKAQFEENEKSEIHAIFPLLKRIVSEKRNEFKRKENITINFETLLTKEHFVKIKKSYFLRTISNIVNNSIEAQKDNSDLSVSITLSQDETGLKISISDNGKGIEKDKIPLIFSYGKSFKQKGSGIGLFQAKEYIESESGKIEMKSKLGHGTTITITLNECHAPSWFAQEIAISKEAVVVVDDDESIHNLWKEKFSKLGIKSIHFSFAKDFEKWASSNPLSSFDYFFDFELLSQGCNGLDLIEKYELQAYSTLVTSHFMDSEIQNRCKSNKMRVLPKESVATLGIVTNSKSHQKTVILIDDDKLIHMAWKREAQKRGIKFYCFYSVNDFLNSSINFDLKTLIYIDSDLGNGLRGEQLSKRIFDLGFKELFLATGYSLPDINKPKWIKEVQGKNFPCGIM